MSEKIKIENFIERLNNADFEQGTKFKFLDKIYLYDYPNLVGVYEIGKPTKSEYSIFSQLDMTNLHCEIEILKPMRKADEMFEELGYIKTKDGIDCWCVYENKIKIIRFEVGFGQALFIEDKKDDFCCINKEEIKAINQKCKELGWLDE